MKIRKMHRIKKYLTVQKATIFSVVLCALFFVGLILIFFQKSIDICENGIPLSSGEEEAYYFLLEHTSSTDMLRSFKIGSGSVSKLSLSSTDVEYVNSCICDFPDTSAYTDNMHEIVWKQIYSVDGHFYVVGELEELKFQTTFESVDELKSSDSVPGLSVKTQGFYSPNDGGAATYIIVETEPTKGISIRLDNGYYAALSVNGAISIKQLGAKGDGISDDSQVILSAFENGICEILISEGTYNLNNSEIVLPCCIEFYGINRDNCILKNVNIVAPFGISLANLTLDGGTHRNVSEPGMNSADNGRDVMLFVTPRGSSSVIYDNCIFKNSDYASLAFWGVDGSYGLEYNSITDCVFENFTKAAVFHSVSIDKGTYLNNTFRNIGSTTETIGSIGALKIGDTSNNTTNGAKSALISKNTFENCVSGDDLSNSKHSIACNFITIYGDEVVIDNNSFKNLLGYGDDREAIYTKVKQLTISNNYIENGGFGEGYICNKSGPGTNTYASIVNNVIIGDYGNGIINYGAGDISGNSIRITNAKSAIVNRSKGDHLSNSLTVSNNQIECGAGLFYSGGVAVGTYVPQYSILLEAVNCPIYLSSNTINITNSGASLVSCVKVGSIRNTVSIAGNNILCDAESAGLELTAAAGYEAENNGLTYNIENNYISVSGQPINIRFNSESQISNRTMVLNENTVLSRNVVDYSILYTTSSADNNDVLYFSSSQEEANVNKNMVYTNAKTIISEKEYLINH